MWRFTLMFVLCMVSMPLRGQTKGQPKSVQRPSDAKTSEPQDSQRGTKESPIFVHILQDPQSQTDAAKTEKDNKRKETVDLVTAWSAGLAALFTGLLVIVGWGGVRAAVRTLAAIERQVTLMERQTVVLEGQTRTNEASVAALINSERAWVVVSKVWPPNLMWESHDLPGRYNTFDFDIQNVGRTVARLTAFRSTSRVLQRSEAPPIPEYTTNPDELTPIQGRIMAPGETIDHLRIVVLESFDFEKFNSLQRGELIMWIYGYIEYVDLADRTHRNQFCYRYVNPMEGPLPTKYIPAGPKGYNTHT
jgi:hypothetical protein